MDLLFRLVNVRDCYTINAFTLLHYDQEAFDAKMGDFISRSRERQRYVLLRAEERTMQDFEASERQRLFGSSSNSRRSANTVADPSAG